MTRSQTELAYEPQDRNNQKWLRSEETSSGAEQAEAYIRFKVATNNYQLIYPWFYSLISWVLWSFIKQADISLESYFCPSNEHQNDTNECHFN